MEKEEGKNINKASKKKKKSTYAERKMTLYTKYALFFDQKKWNYSNIVWAIKECMINVEVRVNSC
jgi:hypothetical protein